MSIINFSAQYVPDPIKGRPLFSGQIYVGEPDLDPEILANQKQLSIVQEDGTKIAVSQPFIIGHGGVPQYNGSTCRLDVSGNYSIKILSKNGSQRYYIHNVFADEPLTADSFGIKDPVSDAATLRSRLAAGYYSVGDVVTLTGAGVFGHFHIQAGTTDDNGIYISDGSSGLEAARNTGPITSISGEWYGMIGDGDGSVGSGFDNTNAFNDWQSALELRSAQSGAIGHGGFRLASSVIQKAPIFGVSPGASIFYIDHSGDGFVFDVEVDGSDFKTYKNFAKVMGKDYSIIKTGLGTSFTPERSGTGIWWKRATRSEVCNIFIRGFEKGIDTSGASWSSVIRKCHIFDNTFGTYHYFIDANEERFAEGIVPSAGPGWQGFNGGSIINCEIQGNDIGIYQAEYANLNVFHSQNMNITMNIIEGNRVRAGRFAKGVAKVNFIRNYCELNGGQLSEFPAGTALVDVVASGTPVSSNPDLVHAQIAVKASCVLVARGNEFVGTGSGVVTDLQDVPAIAFDTGISLLKVEENFFNNYLLWGIGSSNSTSPKAVNNTQFTGRPEINGTYGKRKISGTDAIPGDANIQSIECNISIDDNETTMFEKISFYNSSVNRSANFTIMTVPTSVISSRVVEGRGTVVVGSSILPSASWRVKATGEVEFLYGGSQIPFNTSVFLVH